MHILFVGTGAADYEAALHCDCPNCRHIRAHGGRNMRHYSSLLINGAVLVDCGATVPWRLAELGLPPSCVEAILFTHSHGDHLDPPAVEALLRARRPERGPLPVYANEASLETLGELRGGLLSHCLSPGDAFEVGDLRVTALHANHIVQEEEALNFVVEDGQTRLLYATDTAWPLPTTWRALQALPLDTAIVEATFGLLDGSSHPDCLTHHLNWTEFLRLRKALIEASVLPATAPFLATHLSLHSVPPHDRFSRLAQPPAVVAHDGMTLGLSRGPRERGALSSGSRPRNGP